MGLLEKVKSLFQGRLDVSSRFELLREAISGTMSEFYVARDRENDQIVGLKILDSAKTATFEARFKGLHKPTEGAIAHQVNGHHVVQTLEFGVTNGGQQYLVMEFLEGPGMNSLILERSEKLVKNRIKLIQQMAKSVVSVHKAGFIHRDICPRNFICTKEADSLKLIDFGLSVPAEKEYMLPGNRTGTPNYMAPEIVRRRGTDQRVDVFSMGVTAYQLCTYELPWSGGDNTGMAALMHDTHEPVAIDDLCPHLDPVLATAIMDCLASDPRGRPDSALDFLERIQRLRDEVAH